LTKEGERERDETNENKRERGEKKDTK